MAQSSGTGALEVLAGLQSTPLKHGGFLFTHPATGLVFRLTSALLDGTDLITYDPNSLGSAHEVRHSDTSCVTTSASARRVQWPPSSPSPSGGRKGGGVGGGALHACQQAHSRPEEERVHAAASAHTQLAFSLDVS